MPGAAGRGELLSRLDAAARSGGVLRGTLGRAELPPGDQRIDELPGPVLGQWLAEDDGRPEGMTLRNLRIFDELDLGWQDLPVALAFEDCEFVERPRFTGARLARLHLIRCTAPRGVSLDGVRVDGDLIIEGLRSEDRVLLSDAVVGGRLVLAGSTVSGDRPAVVLDRARVSGDAILDHLRAATGVSATATSVAGRMVLTEARLDPASAAALVSLGRQHAGPATSPAAGDPSPGPDWELLLQVVGLGAALGAWVAVVGGATVWARLANAGLPALPTLAGVGREWMLVEGFRTLLVPVLLGALVSLLVYYTWQPHVVGRGTGAPPTEDDDEPAPSRFPPVRAVLAGARTLGGWQLTVLAALGAVLALLTLLAIARVNPWLVAGAVLAGLVPLLLIRSAPPLWAAIASAAVVGVGLAVALMLAVGGWAWFMLGVTLVAVWVALGAMVGKSARGLAVTVFVVIVGWSGALGYARELGDRSPETYPAVAVLTDGSRVTGDLMGRSTSHLFLDVHADVMGDVDTSGAVEVLPEEQVERLWYGAELTAGAVGGGGPEDDGAPGQGGRHGDGGQGGGGSGSVDFEPQPAPTSLPLEAVSPLATRDGVLHGQATQLQLLRLVSSGGFVELDMRVFNDSADPLRVSSALSAGTDPDVSGLEVLDTSTRRSYQVARADGGCACDSGLDRREVPSGGSVLLSAVFEMPAPQGRTVDVRVPAFGWFRGVPVG